MPRGPWSARQAARLSTHLAQIRKNHGWSLRQVAEKARLSPSTIGDLEKGAQPDLGTLLALQKAYQFKSIEELLGTLTPSLNLLEPTPLGRPEAPEA